MEEIEAIKGVCAHLRIPGMIPIGAVRPTLFPRSGPPEKQPMPLMDAQTQREELPLDDSQDCSHSARMRFLMNQMQDYLCGLMVGILGCVVGVRVWGDACIRVVHLFGDS